MKESVLVIVLAETRAFEHTFPAFKESFLEGMNADLALCVADNEREDISNPFYENANYVWKLPEPEDWGDAFDQAQKDGGYQGDWRALLRVGKQWLGGIKGENEQPGSAGILLFFRYFLKKSLAEADILHKYDRFIVTRSDFMFEVPHVPLHLLDPQYIWIPHGEDYGGFTDRHLVCNREHILPALSISDPIVKDPDTLVAKMNHFDEWNLERFIMFSFNDLGLTSHVRRFPYTMFTIRPLEGHSRWATGRLHQKRGYYIKYRKEYKLSSFARVFIKNQDNWNRFYLRFFLFLTQIATKRKALSNKIKGKTVALPY